MAEVDLVRPAGRSSRARGVRCGGGAQWLARKVMITMVAICMSPVIPAV